MRLWPLTPPNAMRPRLIDTPPKVAGPSIVSVTTCRCAETTMPSDISSLPTADRLPALPRALRIAGPGMILIVPQETAAEHCRTVRKRIAHRRAAIAAVAGTARCADRLAQDANDPPVDARPARDGQQRRSEGQWEQ